MHKTVDQDEEQFPWHLGVYDAHCHPTDTMASISNIRSMKARVLTIMATRAQDQELVLQTAEQLGLDANGPQVSLGRLDPEQRIVPSFGWHPWFSYQMYDEAVYNGVSRLDADAKIAHYQSVLTPKSEDRNFLLSLPDPRPFTRFLNQTRENLLKCPIALIGEVGLDRSFRIPDSWLPETHDRQNEGLTPGGREGRRLSPYRVSLDHQRMVLKAQLELAGELHRPVSVHGVQAHGIVYETLRETWKGHEKKIMSKREQKSAASNKGDAAVEGDDLPKPDARISKPYPPRICLHSYSGPADTVKMYMHPSTPANMFFSFSTAINFSTSARMKTEEAIKAVPDECILVESDLHTAGERMDQHLEDIIRLVCNLKSWSLEDGVKRLGQNWRSFVFGSSS